MILIPRLLRLWRTVTDARDIFHMIGLSGSMMKPHLDTTYVEAATGTLPRGRV